jgi:pyruvate formate lyase activating enzyme
MEAIGTIFDLKRFAVHDGPGIRTTLFLKGCPLRCPWCHNPEGISPRPEVMVFASRCLRSCRDCLAACPRHALRKVRDGIVLDRGRCDGCGACVRVCPSEALQMAGREAAAGALMPELARDRPFYRESGGGVTFSGGEPLRQPAFVRELLARCRREKIHTAVDTSGQAPYAVLEGILPLTDLFLYDLKLVDDARHRRLTGVSNRLLLDNLSKLSASGCALAIRVPLVPGCNDGRADLGAMADFCAALPRRHPVHLLPYHRGYAGKARRLGLDDPLAGTMPPTRASLRRAGEAFSKRGLHVTIGG